MYLIRDKDWHVVMEIIIIAILAEISIFIKLLAIFLHAYVDRFVWRLDSLLVAELAVRQFVLFIPAGLPELKETLLGILLL
jgi:hypothetical protein